MTTHSAHTTDLPSAVVAQPSMGHEDGDLAHLPLNLVQIDAAHNPRSYFEDEAMRSLIESVRENGIIQPITVRPNDDEPGSYHLIAGERRLRAAKAVGMTEIPAIVRLVDADQAHVLATIENTMRDDMSPAEEAQAARKILALCGGDRDEVLRRLGWSRTKLDARLSLLHASQNVLDALAERKIKLGHAELLSTLPEGMQTVALQKVIEAGAGVADLRAKIDAFAYTLEKAVFDTTGCNGCPHNTSQQASLFEASIGGGRCTNPSCWAAKEGSHVQGLKAHLASQYPVIWLDKESAPENRTMLLRGDVGREQAEACKGCAHYGAVLSTQPGKIGEVTEGVCFNLACHTKKVAAHKAELQVTKPATPPIKAPEAPAGDRKAEPKSAKPGKATVSVAATPKKVQELVEAAHRKAAAAEVAADGRMIRVFALASMISDLANRALDAGAREWEGVLKQHGLGDKMLRQTSRRAQLVGLLHGLDDAALAALASASASALAGAKEEIRLGTSNSQQATVSAIHKIKSIDLAAHFLLDKTFLEAHTKGGIHALMAEAGFDKWLDEKDGKGAFKKLMGGKNAEIIEAILQSGFDFRGFVPSSLKIA